MTGRLTAGVGEDLFLFWPELLCCKGGSSSSGAGTSITELCCVVGVVFIQQWGWYLVFGTIALLYLRHRFDPQIQAWRKKRQEQDLANFGQYFSLHALHNSPGFPVNGLSPCPKIF